MLVQPAPKGQRLVQELVQQQKLVRLVQQGPLGLGRQLAPKWQRLASKLVQPLRLETVQQLVGQLVGQLAQQPAGQLEQRLALHLPASPSRSSGA